MAKHGEGQATQIKHRRTRLSRSATVPIHPKEVRRLPYRTFLAEGRNHTSYPLLLLCKQRRASPNRARPGPCERQRYARRAKDRHGQAWCVLGCSIANAWLSWRSKRPYDPDSKKTKLRQGQRKGYNQEGASVSATGCRTGRDHIRSGCYVHVRQNFQPGGRKELGRSWFSMMQGVRSFSQTFARRTVTCIVRIPCLILFWFCWSAFDHGAQGGATNTPATQPEVIQPSIRLTILGSSKSNSGPFRTSTPKQPQPLRRKAAESLLDPAKSSKKTW